MRRLLLLVALTGCLAAGGASGWLLVSSGSDEGSRARAAAQDDAGLPPLPQSRAKAVEPVAGEASASSAAADAPAGPAEDDEDDAAPRKAASATERSEVHGDAPVKGSVTEAAALPNGVAIPPLDAPEQVRLIIQAGNTIARAPYKWGGGHGRWRDNGYDCSGSVSYALHFAGLLDGPADSSALMRWGAPGRGKWITIYSNPGHVFLVVAGIRFDTSGARSTGSRWQNDMRPTGGYVARHVPGL